MVVIVDHKQRLRPLAKGQAPWLTELVVRLPLYIANDPHRAILITLSVHVILRASRDRLYVSRFDARVSPKSRPQLGLLLLRR